MRLDAGASVVIVPGRHILRKGARSSAQQNYELQNCEESGDRAAQLAVNAGSILIAMGWTLAEPTGPRHREILQGRNTHSTPQSYSQSRGCSSRGNQD